jgi:hypothetical protein
MDDRLFKTTVSFVVDNGELISVMRCPSSADRCLSTDNALPQTWMQAVVLFPISPAFFSFSDNDDMFRDRGDPSFRMDSALFDAWIVGSSQTRLFPSCQATEIPGYSPSSASGEFRHSRRFQNMSERRTDGDCTIAMAGTSIFGSAGFIDARNVQVAILGYAASGTSRYCLSSANTRPKRFVCDKQQLCS